MSFLNILVKFSSVMFICLTGDSVSCALLLGMFHRLKEVLSPDILNSNSTPPRAQTGYSDLYPPLLRPDEIIMLKTQQCTNSNYHGMDTGFDLYSHKNKFTNLVFKLLESYFIFQVLSYHNLDKLLYKCCFNISRNSR